jgi:pyruvate/2-oxoglutarate dehydrogenase complex dihydrolipoamide acyltransferase (E2) component
MDDKVVDGASGAAFLADLKSVLEDPESLRSERDAPGGDGR